MLVQYSDQLLTDSHSTPHLTPYPNLHIHHAQDAAPSKSHAACGTAEPTNRTTQQIQKEVPHNKEAAQLAKHTTAITLHRRRHLPTHSSPSPPYLPMLSLKHTPALSQPHHSPCTSGIANLPAAAHNSQGSLAGQTHTLKGPHGTSANCSTHNLTFPFVNVWKQPQPPQHQQIQTTPSNSNFHHLGAKRKPQVLIAYVRTQTVTRFTFATACGINLQLSYLLVFKPKFSQAWKKAF